MNNDEQIQRGTKVIVKLINARKKMALGLVLGTLLREENTCACEKNETVSRSNRISWTSGRNRSKLPQHLPKAFLHSKN